MSEDETPAILLIICEGKVTEPQYFEIVKAHRRVNNGVARVQIFGDRGQHKQLIDEAVGARERTSTNEGIELGLIEVWAVCDKDDMQVALKELQEYAAKHNVKLAFSDPKFEIFLLQHFKQSATNLIGKQLDELLSKEMKNAIGNTYKKNDLSMLRTAFDNEPALLEGAIANCKHIYNQANSPYTTTHELLQRLIDLAP